MGGRIPGAPRPGLPHQGTEEKSVCADLSLQPLRVFRLAAALRLAPRGLGHGLTRSRRLASLIRPSCLFPAVPPASRLAGPPLPDPGAHVQPAPQLRHPSPYAGEHRASARASPGRGLSAGG